MMRKGRQDLLSITTAFSICQMAEQENDLTGCFRQG